MINAESSGNYGLFAQNYGEISNLTIEGYVGVTAENVNAGLFAGNNYAMISNCQNYGTIYSTSNTGGIAGRNNAGIYTSHNNGMINYDYYRENAAVGGVVGIQNSGQMSDCGNSYTGLIQYVGGPSNSLTLQPAMAKILGHLKGGSCSQQPFYLSGTVDKGSLRIIGTHNQALYVSQDAVGRY